MSRTLLAHLRMMEVFRDRITTHEWCGVDKGHGYKRTAEENAELRTKLLRLEAEGFTRREMANECGTTSHTVKKILGPAPYRGRKKAA
jgi:DNA invertase Pin-like site-specific DNA recombinase